MKKIFLLIAMAGALMIAVSCSDDDEPKRGNGVFTVNTPMINHMYNTITGEVLGLSNTHNKLTIDTVKHTASLELVYNDGTEHTLVLKDLTARAKRLGFYELSSSSYAQFSGYVDFNESSMRYRYTTESGLRVVSTMSEVFFLKSNNTIAYDDTTTSTQMENVMYEFSFTPGRDKAVVKVMGITHAKDVKYFNSITAMNVPYTITPNGYVLSGKNIPTTARYIATYDSTFTNEKTTTDYPFKTFDAELDLINDFIDAVYMMGEHATVTATGRTYPDYTAY